MAAIRLQVAFFILLPMRKFALISTMLVAGLPGCSGDDTSATDTDGTDTDGTDTGGTDTGAPACELDDTPTIAAVDESSCAPLATDYQPLENMSADDTYPACISDDGTYHLVGSAPGSIARVEAFENIADLLWRGNTPTPDDFTLARAEYAIDQGLESRVLRREDLHYPEIPMAEWDMSMDPDKQCGVTELALKYPDRCAGPAQMAPLLNEAFAAGQTGEGDPLVHAARIEATLLWFFYLSTYKEANTCASSKGADCDSSWAYYTGGTERGAGLGLSKEVAAGSALSDSRVFDGFLATRCWRDLYPEDTYPTFDDVPMEGQDLFALATEQLDQALHRGFAVVVRDRLERQGMLSGDESTANWAFLRIAGPVLDREAMERDAGNAATLSALWAMDCPSAADVEAGVAALDTIFPCP